MEANFSKGSGNVILVDKLVADFGKPGILRRNKKR